jgi:hypothetical protein
LNKVGEGLLLIGELEIHEQFKSYFFGQPYHKESFYMQDSEITELKGTLNKSVK